MSKSRLKLPELRKLDVIDSWADSPNQSHRK